VAAVVLIGVDFNLELAFAIFSELMKMLHVIYTNQLADLRQIAEDLQQELYQDCPSLKSKVEQCLAIPLFTLFVPPLMGVFANLLS